MIVTRKPALWPMTDKLLVLELGRIKKFGPTEAVINELKAERLAELQRQGIVPPGSPLPAEEPANNPVAAAEQSGIDQEQAARRADAELRAHQGPGSPEPSATAAIQKREVGR